MAPRFALIAAALALAATPAAAAAKPVNARVSPHGGDPEAVLRVGFSAPKPTGKHGAITRGYRVSLALDGGGEGCSEFASRFVDKAKAGERVHRRFVPEAPWCRGRWIGTVGMEETRPCNKSHKPCSGEPTGGTPIAHFHFRIR